MHVQAPSFPITHRAQVVSALAALAVAGGAYGAISIATNDDGSTQSSPGPVVTSVPHGRVLDGSPILRGTANRVDPSRVLDGSPLVRGTANRVDTSRVLDGSPLLRGVAPVTAAHPRLDGAPATALQPPTGRPEGFSGK